MEKDQKNTISTSSISAGGNVHIGDIINIKQIIESESRPADRHFNQNEIRDLIQEDKVRQALELLLRYSLSKDKRLQDEIAALSGRWNGLINSSNQGTVRQEDFNIEKNKIVKAILELNKEGDKDDLNNGGDITPAPLLTPQPLRSFKLDFRALISCFIDLQNRFWAYDEEQIKVFDLNTENLLFKWNLPKRKWKNFFSCPEFDGVIISDWEGNLYLFNEMYGESGVPLRKKEYNSLPVHIISPGGTDTLLVATWDGELLSVKMNDLNRPQKLAHISHLPQKIQYVSVNEKDYIILASQTGQVFLFDNKGSTLHTWRFEDIILDVWGTPEENKLILFFLTENTLIKTKETFSPAHEIRINFSAKITSFSHREIDRKTIFSFDDGLISWLSWNAFRIAEGDSVKLKPGIKTIKSVYDPERPNALLAMGLTDEGKVFVLEDKKHEILPDTRADQILTDREGRFYLAVNNHEAWLNYISIVQHRDFKIDCKIIQSLLIKNIFTDVAVKVINTGKYTISRIIGEIQTDEVIAASRIERNIIDRLTPGDSAELKFSVKSTEQGTLPIKFSAGIFDEIGKKVDEKIFNLQVEIKSQSA